MTSAFNFELIQDNNQSFIKEINTGVRVKFDGININNNNVATCVVTIYKIKGGFVQDKLCSFTAIDDAGNPLFDVDLEVFKACIDFYFLSIMDTDLYIKEIPKTSSLYIKEVQRVFGKLQVSIVL